MIVAIHQPNFLPWLGYFLKMAQADAFIYLDNVPFTKHGYQNRVKIKAREGARWLTVPVLSKGRFGQLTRDIEINNAGRWRDQHVNGLQTEYGRAPYSRPVLDSLKRAYEEADSSLTSFNLKLIDLVADWLALRPRCFFASDLGVEGTGPELLLGLVKAVGGDVYLSGPSGRDYLDLDLFARAGVEIKFHLFEHPVYSQLHYPFIERLSVIDLLLNTGKDGAREVLARTKSCVVGGREALRTRE